MPRRGVNVIIAGASLAVCIGAIGRAGHVERADQQPAPFEPIAFLIGEWISERPGEPEAPRATMTFAWGDAGRMMHYHGTRPLDDGRIVREYEGVITYNGVDRRLEFTAAYSPAVIETGWIEVLGAGSVRRRMDVTYAEGSALPWSDGAHAGPEGRILRFRQSWTLRDPDTIEAEFLMERDGEWEPPDYGARARPGPNIWKRRPADAGAVISDAAREHLAFLASGSGTWLTDNAAYRTPANGEDEQYGMRYLNGTAGATQQGCLFGVTAGRPPQLYWRFFTSWDPTAGKLLVHQVAPSGVIGIGHESAADGVAEQTFAGPDGRTFEVRHRTLKPHPDTLVTESFDRVDGQWEPRRSYRWIRQPTAANTAC